MPCGFHGPHARQKGDHLRTCEFAQDPGQGFAPVDVSNEAYKLGVNWIVYALTH